MTWVISSNEIPFSSAQRCHHAPAVEMKIEKVEEGFDHHQKGYGYDYGYTTEIDDPPSPSGVHAATPTIRAVSPTSSNSSNEHEAWPTEMAVLYKTEIIGSNATVVPELPLEPWSLELDGSKLEEKTPMNDFHLDRSVDRFVGYNVNEKAPPSSLQAFQHTATRAPTPNVEAFQHIMRAPTPNLEAFQHTTTRAPTPNPFEAIEAELLATDENVGPLTWATITEEIEALNGMDWLDETCNMAMLGGGH